GNREQIAEATSLRLKIKDAVGDGCRRSDEPEIVRQVLKVDGVVRHRRIVLQERTKTEAEVERKKEFPPAPPHDAADGQLPSFGVGRRDVNVADDPPLAPVGRRMTFEALEMMTRLWTDGACDVRASFGPWARRAHHSTALAITCVHIKVRT